MRLGKGCIQLFSFLACCELLVPRVLQGMVFVLGNQSKKFNTMYTSENA